MKVKAYDPLLILIREDRQRKDLGDLSELKESLTARGQLQPIVIEEAPVDGDTLGLFLVAGERRLTACRELGIKVQASLLRDLTPIERELVELDENTKRKDLHWTELAKAVARIHALRQTLEPSWTQAQTAESMGYNPSSTSFIGKAITVGGLLDETLAKANSLESAYNIVSRQQSRQFADIANEILAPRTRSEPHAEGTPYEQPMAAAPELPILNGSFLEWAPTYSGPKFNFIHCDFPYGVGLGESDQMQADAQEVYDDSEEVYWQLLMTFAQTLDNFCYPSAHVMFWFSMKFYEETKAFLRKETDLRVYDIPLVWLKSDNAGILPDHRRYGRNVYETAFLCSRGDRFIVKPVANAYAAPTASKKIHPSEKPEPVLKHFFQQFLDSGSEVFDPTCGGGSALRAADPIAKRVFGIELSPEFSSAANAALTSARALRKAAG